MCKLEMKTEMLLSSYLNARNWPHVGATVKGGKNFMSPKQRIEEARRQVTQDLSEDPEMAELLEAQYSNSVDGKISQEELTVKTVSVNPMVEVAPSVSPTFVPRSERIKETQTEVVKTSEPPKKLRLADYSLARAERMKNIPEKAAYGGGFVVGKVARLLPDHIVQSALQGFNSGYEGREIETLEVDPTKGEEIK